MKIDGSGKCRLSGFNDAEAPVYRDVDGGIGLGDFDMGPDGKTIVAKIGPRHGQESTVVIVFDFSKCKSQQSTLLFLTPLSTHSDAHFPFKLHKGLRNILM